MIFLIGQKIMDWYFTIHSHLILISKDAHKQQIAPIDVVDHYIEKRMVGDEFCCVCQDFRSSEIRHRLVASLLIYLKFVFKKLKFCLNNYIISLSSFTIGHDIWHYFHLKVSNPFSQKNAVVQKLMSVYKNPCFLKLPSARLLVKEKSFHEQRVELGTNVTV